MNSTIFKTFDSDIKKCTTKIGIFGKSFSELGTAVNNAFELVINNIDNFDENIGFWESLKKNLFSSKENNKDWIKNSLGEIISKENIGSYIKELDLESAKNKLANIFDWEDIIKNSDKTWQDYFDTLSDGEKYLVDTIKNTSDLSKLTGEDLIKANQSAREAAIAHNAALQQQTLGAKAATVATKALAIAGNMIAYALIAKGIELAANAIDHYINRAKYAAEAMEEAQQAINDSQNRLKEISTALSDNRDRFLELSQGVDKFSNNLKLSEDDYAEYLSLCNQFADLFPNLVAGYDDQGNALLAIGTNADETNAKLQSLLETQQAVAQQTLIDNMDDVANGIYFEVKDSKDAIGEMEGELAELQQKYEAFNIDIADSKGQILFNYQDYDKYGTAMEEALSSAGIKFEKKDIGLTTAIQLSSALPGQLAQAQKLYDAWMETENEYYHASENGLKRDMEAKEKAIQVSYSKMTANLQAWVKDNYNYQYLSDGAAGMVDALLPEIRWDEVEGPLMNAYDYQNYIEEHIIKPLMEVPNEHKQELDDMFRQLLSFEDGDLSILSFAQELRKKLNEFGISIDITPVIADEQEAKDKLRNSVESIAEGGSGDFFTSSGVRVDADDYKELQEYTKDFNTAQIELWSKATLGAENAAKAIQKYEEALKSALPDASFSDIFSLEDTEGSATTLGALSKSVDDIQSAYQTLSSAIDEYNENGSFSIDTLQSVMGLGDNWLDYLVDENGTLTLDREALQRLTQSRLEDMRVQAVNNLIDNVSKIQNDADANLYLASTNYAAADSFEALAWQSANAAQELLRAKVVSGDLSQENYDAIVAKMGTDINKVNQLFANTDFTSGLSSDNSFGSSNAAGEDTYQELVDFFERRTKVLDNASSLLESNLENVAGSYAKNTLIDSQLGIAEERFRNYTDAVSMYSKKASAALSKLPADLAQKVKNGSVSMTDFIGSGNEDVVDAIKDYENWAEKIADCEQELAGLKAAIRQLELDKFNNIMEDFTSRFDIHENANDLIDKQIALFEEAGELIGESFYTTQMEESKKQLDLLEQEKAELVDQLNSALSSGRIQAGTDEWLEMVNALSEVDGSILDCKTSMEELDNAILDLHTQIFDRIQEQFSGLNSELENLYGLFDEDTDVTDGNRNWTDAAMAQLGLLAQQYELSRYQVQQYDKEIADLNSAYLNGRYSAVEYADKLAGLCSAQWDAVNSAESIKDSIMDLNETRVDEIVDGIQEETDAYKELTDAQIDALKAEKELHDYEASIAEKTKSVTDLEKQLAAMENDNTAATIAKRLRLEEELAQAKKELKDAEYEHSIEAQEEALNQQYEDYEAARNEEITALQESLLNKEAILFQSFETVKQNSAIVGEQIAMTAQQHGVTVSNALLSAWASGENAIAGYGAVLSEQSSAFILHIMEIEAETWNLQNQADMTAGTLANMFSARADNLVQQLTDSWYCEDTLNTMTDILHQSLIDTLEGGYDVSSITNALSSITDSANRAAAAFRDLYGTQTGSSGKWYIIDQKTNQILSRGFKDQNEALSWVPAYAKANRGGTVTVRQFAKGTRNAEGGLRIVNEKGYELVLSKLSSGNYSIGGKGDQILTKEQTDNIFDWAKINPDVYSLMNPVTPVFPSLKEESAPVTINYDSLVHVEGDVNNSNMKQIQAAVQDGLKQFAIQINRDYRYGRK